MLKSFANRSRDKTGEQAIIHLQIALRNRAHTRRPFENIHKFREKEMKKTSQLCQQHRAEFFFARDREEKEAESRIKTLYDAICWLCELRKLQLGSIKNKQ